MVLNLRRKLLLVSLNALLLMLVLTLVLPSVYSADYVAFSKNLKSEYRQNEYLEIIGVIYNNRSDPLTVKSFNVIIVISELRGRNKTVVANITKEIDRIIKKGQSLTAYISINLRNFLPDKYNVSAFFVIQYSGFKEETIYVLEDFTIRVKPYVEIPPAVTLVLALSIGIIIIFVGYGIAGRFLERKR